MNYSSLLLGLGICLFLLLPTSCYELPDFYIEYFNLSSKEIWVDVHGITFDASPGWVMPSRFGYRLPSAAIHYDSYPPTIDDVIAISWSTTKDGPSKEVKFKRGDYGIPRYTWYGKLTVIFTAEEKWGS